MEQLRSSSFWERPKSHQLTVIGHVLTLMATAAFAAAKIAALAERGALPDEPIKPPSSGDCGPLSAADYFHN